MGDSLEDRDDTNTFLSQSLLCYAGKKRRALGPACFGAKVFQGSGVGKWYLLRPDSGDDAPFTFRNGFWPRRPRKHQGKGNANTFLSRSSLRSRGAAFKSDGFAVSVVRGTGVGN